MTVTVPDRARVVIVGGGVAGCSVAYGLATNGWKDVVLLEQNQLGSGTSWHAAGAVGRFRTPGSFARMSERSAQLYAGLEQETGLPTGFKMVGGLSLAQNDERMIQLRRAAALAGHFGVEVQIISPTEVAAIWPFAVVDDLVGAALVPGDPRVDPELLPRAIAQGARLRGATIIEGVRVLDLLQANGRITGVRTEGQDIEAEYVVIAGGMWTRQLALSCGVSVPLHPVEHHYLISNPTGQDLTWTPVTRDLDFTTYFRGHEDRILIGAFQKKSKPWLVDRVPDEFAFSLLEPDWEHFEQPLREGYHRLPLLREIGFEKFVNGPESFTPDGNPILGETPEIAGLYVLAGFNSSGLAFAGGAGEALAQWIIGGEQPFDLWPVDVRRFGPWQNNRRFLRERTVETLGMHFRLAVPNTEFELGRGLKCSPLHGMLDDAGASFGQKMGYERPNWFARSTEDRTTTYSFGRQNWFDNHRREHLAARESVAVFDQSSFGKISVTGSDALALLQRACANEIDVSPDTVVYTGMFNTRGTFESDVTVIRTGLEAFHVITGTAQIVRDIAWLRRLTRDGEAVSVIDVSSATAVIGVMGPNSRGLLQSSTDSDLSNLAFPFATVQTIALGATTCRAVRITYVGELGWELHIPADQAMSALSELWRVGGAYGLTNAGHYAINSLRIEKGYRAFGPELNTDYNAFEAGLVFAIGWDKKVDFCGREALRAVRHTGAPLRRLVSFCLLDAEPILWGGERCFRDGRVVGYTTSGAYGHTVGCSVALGYVASDESITEEYLQTGSWEIDIAGTRVSAYASLSPPYDPVGQRIRS